MTAPLGLPKWRHVFGHLERETSVGTFKAHSGLEPVTVRLWAGASGPGWDHTRRFESEYAAAAAVDAWLEEQGID